MITIDGARYILGLFSNLEQPLPELWVALSGGTLGPTATGVDIVEPLPEEYERVRVDSLSGSWHLTGTTLSNALTVAFPEAVEPWGLIRGIALCTEAEGGKILFEDELPEPVYVDAGSQVSLTPGAIVFDFDVDRWSL